MLTYHHWSSMAVTWLQFHKRYLLHQLSKLAKFNSNFPWINELRQETIPMWSILDSLSIHGKYSRSYPSHRLSLDDCRNLPLWHLITINQCLWHGVHASWEQVWMCTPLIARFMGPTWGPAGADRTQVGPMLAPWTLLSGSISFFTSNSVIFVYFIFIIWNLILSIVDTFQ